MKSHTPPESIVFGTAISIGFRAPLSRSVNPFEFTCGMPSLHIANEQKLRVFTVKICRIHGCFDEAIAVASMGRVFSRSPSSSGPRRHTMSLLSLPCLETLAISVVDHLPH